MYNVQLTMKFGLQEPGIINKEPRTKNQALRAKFRPAI